MVEDGPIELVGRGLYRTTDADPVVNLDLVEVAHRVPDATLCLVSALARHGLTDQIRPPSMSRSPVADAHPG